MKDKICICGHNEYSHENEMISQWHSLTHKIRPIIIKFQSCIFETCRCEKFREHDRSKGRLKLINTKSDETN